MNLPPIPASLLKPLADKALALAQDKLGKGNPTVGLILGGISKLIGDHGANVPADLQPVKQQISESLANDFAAMDAAAGRAQEAGRFRG